MIVKDIYIPISFFHFGISVLWRGTIGFIKCIFWVKPDFGVNLTRFNPFFHPEGANPTWLNSEYKLCNTKMADFQETRKNWFLWRCFLSFNFRFCWKRICDEMYYEDIFMPARLGDTLFGNSFTSSDSKTTTGCKKSYQTAFQPLHFRNFLFGNTYCLYQPARSCIKFWR